MTNYFICSDISNSIQHTNSTLDNIVASITTDTEKAYFIYAYSLFESTITEIVRYYLKAFPYKIDKNITVNKELVLMSSRSSIIIDDMIDQNIRKHSNKSLYEYLQFFVSIQDLDLSIDEYNFKGISNLRNSIVHDDIKNSLIYKHTNSTKTSNEDAPTTLYKDYICYFIQFLNSYDVCMKTKYSEYTLDKLARTIWKNTFSTPLLAFDAVWEYHSEGYLQFKNIDDLKNRASSLCNSEHLLLAVFLQQYNHTINEYVHGFNKIPSLVSIDTDNKSKLVELIDFFDSFPLLFNGEIIKPSTPK